MKTEIGEAAGKIWDILNAKGKVTLQQIPRLLNQSTVISYQAVGWLAREDKIRYHNENKKVYISLT